MRSLVLGLLLLWPRAGLADYLEVRRNAYIYAEPSRTSQQLDQIQVGQGVPTVYLYLAGDGLTNGYYRVRLRSGSGTGWIYKTLVRRFPGTPPSAGPGGAAVIEPGSFDVASDVMVAHFIDVGQGAATLLEFSCGAVLIDAGGEQTDEVNGTANLLAYLDRLFARRTDLNRTIDLLVLTHAHIDHTRSVPDLIGRYRIRSTFDNGLRSGSGGAQQRRLQDFAAARADVEYQGIETRDIGGGDGLTNQVIDPVNCAGTDPRVRVLWGSVDADPGWSSGAFDNGNNHSVVVRVDFGESSFLFTGDLQEDAVEDLVATYQGTGTLDVDVYQVGHHGSHNGTTRELMEAMTPAVAVIAMGNQGLSRATHSAYGYGHPRDEAVEQLRHAEYGVRARRAEPVTVPVGERGACSSCKPPRPPVFANWTIERAIYGTGWEGTVRISARADGQMRVAAER